MRYKCGTTWEYDKAKKERWHKWFAWHPVTVHIDKKTGQKYCVWLQTIERFGDWQSNYADSGWFWKYRELDND